MDTTVHEGSRISRLPKALQVPAVMLRNLLPTAPPAYVYQADGMATHHYSPFLYDDDFRSRYRKVADRWTGSALDVRWRVWMQVQCVRQCQSLPGSFAEFGVYRGACSYMMLSALRLRDDQSFWLFDTFEGIPDAELTPEEVRAGFAGRLSDTSAQEVAEFLSPWKDHVRLVPGNVFDTLPTTSLPPLAFAHIDLNAAAPTEFALEHVYPRMLPAGIVLFDDYGSAEYDVQRKAIESFFGDKREQVFALPTGQGMVVKLPPEDGS